MFAHHDLGVSVDDLFGKTLVGDIEDLLHNLNRIRTAVFQLLENGRQQWIANDDRTYTDPFIADTRNALSRLGSLIFWRCLRDIRVCDATLKLL